MSRARDIADFNASLFADDEISGDKVSDGTIGAGTFNGTIGSSATGGSGLTAHGRIGKVCWVTKTSTTNNLQSTNYISNTGTDSNQGWSLMVNSDSNMYSTSSDGITVALEGTYLVQFSAYFYNQSSTNGYMEVQVYKKPSGGSLAALNRAYQITNNATGGNSSEYHNNLSSAIVSLNANDLVDLYINGNQGTYTIHGAETNLRLTYLDSNTFTM